MHAWCVCVCVSESACACIYVCVCLEHTVIIRFTTLYTFFQLGVTHVVVYCLASKTLTQSQTGRSVNGCGGSIARVIDNKLLLQSTDRSALTHAARGAPSVDCAFNSLL